MVQEHKFIEAAAAANESCDPHEYGPCSECQAREDKLCGYGKSVIRKFRGACIIESEDLALTYCDKIIDWTVV